MRARHKCGREVLVCTESAERKMTGLVGVASGNWSCGRCLVVICLDVVDKRSRYEKRAG